MAHIKAGRAITPKLSLHRWRIIMGLILLEALGALFLLVLIVWWTMFSGRKKGELPRKDDEL
jgi:cbb3-type cytochrome oxidase subunit 3